MTALRAKSATEFFANGIDLYVTFEVGADGKPVSLEITFGGYKAVAARL